MEAHACDEWPLGKAVTIAQHKTLEERIAAAKKFKEEMSLEISLAVDLMDNNFNSAYSSWPERAYIIEGDRLAYVCQLKADGSLDWEQEIEKWLHQRFSSSS